MCPSHGCSFQQFETNKHTARVQPLLAHRAASLHRKKRRHLSKFRLPSAILRPADMHHCSYWLGTAVFSDRAYQNETESSKMLHGACRHTDVETSFCRSRNRTGTVEGEKDKEERRRRSEAVLHHSLHVFLRLTIVCSMIEPLHICTLWTGGLHFHIS